MNRISSSLLVLGSVFGALSTPCQAQMIQTEERFQDLFVTAGYGTAFGAAFGAALLSFQAKPQDNLRFVAIGASVGFIGGSLIGGYVIFSPALTRSDRPGQPYADLQPQAEPGLRIVPSFDAARSYQLRSWEGQWTLASF